MQCDHGKKHCAICCVDYRSKKEIAAEEASMALAAKQAKERMRKGHDNTPISFTWAGQQYETLMPGTIVRSPNRMLEFGIHLPAEALKSTVLAMETDRKEPTYLLRANMSRELMRWPCHEVHDAWLVESRPVRAVPVAAPAAAAPAAAAPAPVVSRAEVKCGYCKEAGVDVQSCQCSNAQLYRRFQCIGGPRKNPPARLLQLANDHSIDVETNAAISGSADGERLPDSVSCLDLTDLLEDRVDSSAFDAFPKASVPSATACTVVSEARAMMQVGGNPAELLSEHGISQEALREQCPVVHSMKEVIEAGAVIRCCARHGLEVCDAGFGQGGGPEHCFRDFRVCNCENRKGAARATAAADAHIPLGFTPRQIPYSLNEVPGRKEPKIFYSELPPGTKVRQVNLSGDGRPDAIGCIIGTDFDHPTEGSPFPGAFKTLPHYHVQIFDNDVWTVPCEEVHFKGAPGYPAQWKIEEAIQVGSMLASLPGAGSRSSSQHQSHLGGPSDDSSIVTSAVTLESTRHVKQRFEEREIVRRQFQSAVKHAHLKKQPGNPTTSGEPSWLLVHDGAVFCSDDLMKTMLTAWPMLKKGDVVLTYKLQDVELNNRIGRIVTDYDERTGRWGVDFGDQQKRVRLRNVKPAPEARLHEAPRAL